MPKDVAFVLDTSGSMAGAKLEQARKALIFCLANLNDLDRFEIIRFSTEIEPLFDGLVPADADHRRRAEAFVKALKPTGGTAIADALQRALSLRRDDADRPYAIVFLTDGLPTVGETDEDRILARIQAPAGGAGDGAPPHGPAKGARIFCFGIGHDVNTHLLDKIAETTRAAAQFVHPEEDLEVKVSSFYAKIKDPLVANPEILFPEGAQVSRVYPGVLPDLFKGDQVVAVGRCRGAVRGEVMLSGSTGGARRSWRFAVDFKTPDRGAGFLPRLWATRRIGFLLDEIRLRGESYELRDEVSELARRFGVVTPYTSHLILEDEQRRAVPLALQSLPALREDAEVQRQAATFYDEMLRQKTGLAGVASARSARQVATAPRPTAAISGAAEEMEYRFGGRKPVGPAPASPAGVRPADPSVAGRSAAGQAGAARMTGYLQQGRYVDGRTFYPNGGQWIDSLIQKHPQARRVQLPFGSEDYFDLVRRAPETRAWVALGQRVQFIHKDTIYAIAP
jgi:Ca-activated chloride channel family protein